MMDKTEILESIKSKPGGYAQYKIVPMSPLRYMGGKSRAVGYIIEKIPAGTTRIVSPFFGGGSAEIALNKLLGIEVVGYDVFDYLTNYWKYQIEQPRELAAAVEKIPTDKATFDRIRTEHKDLFKWGYKASGFDDAVEYYYQMAISYGPMFAGWYSKEWASDKKVTATMKKCREFDVKGISVSTANFWESIPKHKDDFLFLDPPYYLEETKNSKSLHGTMYPNSRMAVHHIGFDHELLAKLLKEHRGGFLLTYNDTPEIRELYKDFEFSTPEWRYTMSHTNLTKKSNELFIVGKKRDKVAESKFSITADYANSEWVLKLKTTNKRKKIAGHRFVELLGMSPYSHPISLVLGAYGFWRIDDNEYMAAGRHWEKPILDVVANPGFEMFSFEQYEGNCFHKEGAWWDGKFGGLMDAYDPKTKTIWEAKVWFGFKVKDEKKATWFQQLALYWKLWSDMHPGELIDAGVAFLKAPRDEQDFNPSDVWVEQLPQEYRNSIEDRMKQAMVEYDKVTKDTDGVIVARSKMTKKITDEINWLKEAYKDWGIELVDEKDL